MGTGELLPLSSATAQSVSGCQTLHGTFTSRADLFDTPVDVTRS
jgi:hypothetical protein